MIRNNSQKLYAKAKGCTPYGVSSPVRSFAPFPVFMKDGRGDVITDVDGNDYIDFCMAYGPLIFGHAPERVSKIVKQQIDKGTVYGTPSELELDLLKKICARLPCATSVRLTNSGTEATMHALRLARGHTGKNGIVKINGGFHGAHDALLAKASADKFASCIPNSKGVPEDAVRNTYSVEYNDTQSLSDLLTKRDDIAALIMEPIMGNCGVITPNKGYLDDVRKITSENDVLLIFDEVITGFRVARDSAQGLYGVTPDLCTLGKIIGGGFPAGAVAGKKAIMNDLAPSGGIYQAGTFSGNPITAAAGSAMLDLLTPEIYRRLRRKTDIAVSAMNDAIFDNDVKACIQSENSMFQVFFGVESVENHADSLKVDAITYREMFKHMLDSRIYIPPAAFEVNFISSSHTDEHIQQMTELFKQFIGGV